MAKKDHNGSRKKRDHRAIRRTLLGYYVIATDTEGTEKIYFDGLRDSLPPELHRNLVIRTFETRTQDLITRCLRELSEDPQYRQGWIVFDRDEVIDFDQIIREAGQRGLHCGWSNPCFEIWLYAYYGKMPNFSDSQNCWKSFGNEYQRRTGLKYSKTDLNLYERLTETGNEEAAVTLAAEKLRQCIREGKTVPSEMCPCTTVFQFVNEIKEIVKKETI